MIKINLATRKQAVGASAGGGAEPRSKGLALPKMSFSGLSLEGMKDLPIRRLGLFLVVAVAVTYISSAYKDEEINKWDTELKKIQAEQTKLKAELAQTKGFEEKKKSLDADEKTIRTKIEIVEKLIADRQVPPKLLETLSASTPTDVWLSDMKLSEESLKIHGLSASKDGVSDFIKNLRASVYFSTVDFQGSHEDKDDLGSRADDFELLAKRR